jgi:hypothetical protein
LMPRQRGFACSSISDPSFPKVSLGRTATTCRGQAADGGFERFSLRL